MSPDTLGGLAVGCVAGAGGVLLGLAYLVLRVGFSALPKEPRT